MGILKVMSSLGLTVVASLVLILLGIIYFILTIWIIKIGEYGLDLQMSKVIW